jgi:hypothetical protein
MDTERNRTLTRLDQEISLGLLRLSNINRSINALRGSSFDLRILHELLVNLERSLCSLAEQRARLSDVVEENEPDELAEAAATARALHLTKLH